MSSLPFDEASLPAAGSIYSRDSAFEALAKIQAQVAAGNEDLRGSGITGGFQERFEKWLKRCYELLQKIVEQISTAVSFTVNAATPWTAGVSITFRRPA